MNEYSDIIDNIYKEFWKNIIGQEKLIRDLLICLLCRGHILLEWSPW